MVHQEIFVEPDAAKCDKPGTERISPHAFQQSGILDWNTRITSSVNVAMLGDSVGIQFGQALQKSAGGTLENFIILKKLHKRFNLMSILRTSRGNGTFANFRIAGLLSEQYKNQSRRLPNKRLLSCTVYGIGMHHLRWRRNFYMHFISGGPLTMFMFKF